MFFKFFGRSGRGLSIIKRGLFKLKGRMLFTIEGNIVETGFDIPAEIVDPKIIDVPISIHKRKRVVYFKNNDLIHSAIENGLKDFIINKDELNLLISSVNDSEKVEIVSDEEINIPESFILRLVTKKERIEGLALNWIGDSK